VISVRGLRKSYGDNEAVRGIDLEVDAGGVFAFLGPNGAGKTTTVEILEGYRKRSGGEVTVLGEDPERAGRAWRERIGIVLQNCRLDPYLTARESLELYAGYYSRPRPVDEVIELVGLGGKADERTGRLSGGQQRRLDVGMALVGDPELLFLDEPTTGFDPAARRQAWETIAGLRALGKTVFLTTHYMDEAQQLADRVAILAGGEVAARGRPEELGDRGSQPTVITYRGPEGDVSLTTTTPVETLNELTGRALAEGFELADLEVRRPSLEDVYLELTDQAASATEPAPETEGAASR
jgi:ABC-2 type transport system ATP-binding protein